MGSTPCSPLRKPPPSHFVSSAFFKHGINVSLKLQQQAAQAVLDARAKHATSTLADLYDPLTMPPDLAKAHAALDAAVDRCYRPAAFPNDRARVEHLFALYEAITAPLAPAPKKKRGGRKA